jgi:hypothetical protein
VRARAALLDAVIHAKALLSPGFAWAISNGKWTLGTKDPLETAAALQKYSLAGVRSESKAMYSFWRALKIISCRSCKWHNSKEP